MKKVLIIFTLLVAFTVFSIIVIDTPSKVLYLLNWGEYIDHDVVKRFEEKYNCQVIEEDVVSSEAMYQKITAKTTTYDVAIPGDYVVYQLYHEGYLMELDANNPEYEYINGYKTNFTDSLRGIIDEYMLDEETKTPFDTYFMPYLWGAYSIVYSERKDDVKDVIKNNGFKALYDRSLYKEEVKIGMYDTARWIVASYLMANGYDPNITKYDLVDGKKVTSGDLDITIQNDVIKALKTTLFDQFNNDQLKRDVVNGQLDMCFVQLGDFFDALYFAYDEATDSINIDFNVYVPKTTAAFFDSMIIPTTCQNYDLANKFINFMLTPENAYDNARTIGYCPALKKVCEYYRNDAENGEYYYGDNTTLVSLTLKDFLDNYPMYLDPLYGTTSVYVFEAKSNKYLTTCETIFNNLS